MGPSLTVRSLRIPYFDVFKMLKTPHLVLAIVSNRYPNVKGRLPMYY